MSISVNANIDKTARIMEYVVIEDFCEIGKNSFLGNGCVLRPYTKIGDDCVIGHLCVFEGHTEIGDRTHIMSQCHLTTHMIIEGDVFIGPRVATGNDRTISYRRKEYTPKGPHIKRAARIGIGAILLPEITVGENALVAAGALVVKDVPDRKIVMGRPAEIVGDVPKEDWI